MKIASSENQVNIKSGALSATKVIPWQDINLNFITVSCKISAEFCGFETDSDILLRHISEEYWDKEIEMCLLGQALLRCLVTKSPLSGS